MTASDGSNLATVNVTVWVVSAAAGSGTGDAYTLQFAVPVYTFDVPEQAIVPQTGGSGIIIGLVSATLASSSGLYLDVTGFPTTYRVVSYWVGSKFSIDPAYGTLLLVGNVDYETVCVNLRA